MPLFVRPPLKSKEGLLLAEKVPEFVNKPVIIFVPAAAASLNVPLLEIVLKAVKSNPAKASELAAGIVNALFTVVFPPKVFIPLVPLKTKLL